MSNQSIVLINDKSYVVNAFKGRIGWSYLPRLTKYVFPFIGYAFNEEKTEEDVAANLMMLLSGDNAKEVENLVLEIISGIQVDNMPIDVDKEFERNYDTLILLFIEVIKLNYFDSFQRLVTNLPKQ